MGTNRRHGMTGAVAALALAGAMLGWVAPAGAQTAGLPGGSMGYNAVVGRLFNDIPAFSATVDTALTNASDKSRLSVPMRMMKREDRLRIEVDLVKLQGSGLDLQGLAAMQNIGMARMDSVISPADRAMHVLFPQLKFASKVPLSEADMPNAGFKVTKKTLGRDTLQGQACVRRQVILTDAKGGKTEATVWEATALNDFPVRIAFRTDDSSVVMTFTGVSLSAPPEDQFRVPPDYKSFDSMTVLMQEAVTKGIRPGR